MRFSRSLKIGGEQLRLMESGKQEPTPKLLLEFAALATFPPDREYFLAAYAEINGRAEPERSLCL
jgi:hypothetical protein